MPSVKDETGNVYGELTVIKRNGSIRGLAAWLCKCSCGNETTVPGAYLRNGNTKSCGCKKYSGFERQREIQNKGTIKIGNKFGKLTVIKELDLRPHGTQGHNRRWYLCQCDCGNICEAMGNAIKNGQKSSCGCLSSKGELKIEQLLKDNNINYKREVIDNKLLEQYNRRLRFDFGIYDKRNNLIKYIEFDGRQHIEGMDKGVWSQSESLEVIQERDKIKNEFCKNNNIELTRISYKKLNSLSIEDLI